MAENARPKRTDLLYLDPDVQEIEVVEGFNKRMDYGDLTGLAESIKQNGIRNPLQGYKRNGKFIITGGHRRWKAVQILKDEGVHILVPFVSEPKKYSDEDRTFDQIVANDGKPFNMLEKAEVFKQLIAYGYNEQEISKRVGKSATHINDCIKLSAAPKKLKNQIMAGNISASQVLEMLKEDDGEEVAKKVEEAAKESNGKKVTRKHLKKEGAAKSNKAGLKKLRKLQELLEQSDVDSRSQEAFDVLNALLDYAEDKADIQDLNKVFFKRKQEADEGRV